MIEMRTTSDLDTALLKGLLQSNPKDIHRIYDLALPSVIHWVLENSGSEEDARDVFQEALTALFKRLKQGNFNLTCTLKSYLRIICRNLWLTRLRNQVSKEAPLPKELENIQVDHPMEQMLERSEKEQLYYTHFDALGEKCKQILQWFFDKTPLKEIAKRLDTSEGYIKKRKFQCKKQLIEAIQSDAKFKELSAF